MQLHIATKAVYSLSVVVLKALSGTFGTKFGTGSRDKALTWADLFLLDTSC